MGRRALWLARVDRMALVADQLAFDLMSLGPQLSMLWVQMTLMPVRRPALLVALVTTSALVVIYGKSYMPDATLGFVAGLVMCLGVLLFYRRDVRWSQRLVAAALGIVVTMIGEVVVASLWTAAGGVVVGDYEAAMARPLDAVLMHLLDMLLIIVGGRLLQPLMWRWRTRSRGYGGDTYLAMLPVSHALFIMMVVWCGVNLLDDPRGLWLGMCVLATACLVIDVLMVVTMDRYRMGQLERQRAEALEGRLNACLSGYAGLAAQVEEASRLRHDLRNHLQVAGALVERGDLERAGAYVADVAQAVRGEDADGVPSAGGYAAGEPHNGLGTEVGTEVGTEAGTEIVDDGVAARGKGC